MITLYKKQCPKCGKDQYYNHYISFRHATKIDTICRKCSGEKHSISLLGENNPFYGKHHSEGTKRKISETLKVSMNGPEVIKKLSNLRTGKKHSEETKKKMSESRKGNRNHNFGKVGYFKGKKFSEEHKQKIAKSHIGIRPSSESRIKMSNAQKGEKSSWFGKKHTDEYV